MDQYILINCLVLFSYKYKACESQWKPYTRKRDQIHIWRWKTRLLWWPWWLWWWLWLDQPLSPLPWMRGLNSQPTVKQVIMIRHRLLVFVLLWYYHAKLILSVLHAIVTMAPAFDKQNEKGKRTRRMKFVICIDVSFVFFLFSSFFSMFNAE